MPPAPSFQLTLRTPGLSSVNISPLPQRLPPWYVILKVCLPSTIGLIKEPELLENMYSKKAEEEHKRVRHPSLPACT